VKPAPATDQNGVPIPGDYVAQVRENLGAPSDFNQEPQSTTERDSVIETRAPDGNIVPHVSRYTRVDN
jgi:hypothetical protein